MGRRWKSRIVRGLSVVFFLLIFVSPSIAVDYSTRVQQAYVAYYGRPADPGGLDYWSGQLAQNGGNLSAIIQAFGTSQEFVDRYGRLSQSELIDTIYRQMFNRDPDEAGKAYYLEQLRLGRMTLQTITLQVMDGAPAGSQDRKTIENKVIVAKFFTDRIRSTPQCPYIGAQAAEQTKAILSEVNYMDQSVNWGKFLTDYRFCRSVKCPSDTSTSMDALSSDQKAFITSRGNPVAFSIIFGSERLNSQHVTEYAGSVRRIDSWFYNAEKLTSVVFDNGYFVEEKELSNHNDRFVPTHLSPALFTACMTRDDVIAVMGEPTCIRQERSMGRIYTYLLYNPSNTIPAATVVLENNMLVNVTAGYAISYTGTNQPDLCNIR
ncbi:MAG: DUF4214 domain-containing protein [Thermodesulforhabdaceae bacterium]